MRAMWLLVCFSGGLGSGWSFFLFGKLVRLFVGRYDKERWGGYVPAVFSWCLDQYFDRGSSSSSSSS